MAKRLIVAGLGMLMVLGMATLVAPTASAASGHIYISMPTWLGNCPGGGSVRYLQVSTWSFGSGGTDRKADFGDDLVHISAGLREDVQVTAKAICYNGKKTYHAPGVSHMIRPARAGQTWWIGPAGVRKN